MPKYKKTNTFNSNLSVEHFKPEDIDRILWASQSFKKEVEKIVGEENKVEMSIELALDTDDFSQEEEK